MGDNAKIKSSNRAPNDSNVEQEAASSNLKILVPQITAAAISASFFLIAGMSYHFPTSFLAQSIDEPSDFDITADHTFWIVAVTFFTNSLAGILCGALMDTFGRLNTIKLSTVWTLVAWIMVAFAKNGTTMIAARIITGFSVVWSVCPGIVYIAEIAHPDFRGSLISFTSVFQSLGTFVLVIEEMFINRRLIAASACMYAVVVLILVLFIPESPLWLISRGRKEDARNALNWFNKHQPNVTSSQFQSLTKDQDKTGGFVPKLKQFLKPSAYKPLMILLGLFIFQQFFAIYLHFFHTPEYFEELGRSLDVNFILWFYPTLHLLVEIVNIFLFKIFRRRTLLIYGCASMSLSTFIQGLDIFLTKQGVAVPGWIIVTSVILYFVAYMVSLSPIPLMLAAEIFPTEVRGMAHSLVFSLVWFSSYWITFFGIYKFYFWIGYLKESADIQWFFTGLALMALLFAYFFCPETHGVKLAEVQKNFEEGNYRCVKTRRNSEDGKQDKKLIMEAKFFNLGENVLDQSLYKL